MIINIVYVFMYLSVTLFHFNNAIDAFFFRPRFFIAQQPFLSKATYILEFRFASRVVSRYETAQCFADRHRRVHNTANLRDCIEIAAKRVSNYARTTSCYARTTLASYIISRRFVSCKRSAYCTIGISLGDQRDRLA